jgi:hypothetical protein
MASSRVGSGRASSGGTSAPGSLTNVTSSVRSSQRKSILVG